MSGSPWSLFYYNILWSFIPFSPNYLLYLISSLVKEIILFLGSHIYTSLPFHLLATVFWSVGPHYHWDKLVQKVPSWTPYCSWLLLQFVLSTIIRLLFLKHNLDHVRPLLKNPIPPYCSQQEIQACGLVLWAPMFLDLSWLVQPHLPAFWLTYSAVKQTILITRSFFDGFCYPVFVFQGLVKILKYSR